MITRGTIYRPEQLEGFAIESDGDWIGLATFIISNHECEVTSLDSLHAGQGIGTTLLETILKEAKARSCKRLFLITTNDNLNALGFYQKRGFEIVQIHHGAINESRKLKPSIPLIGMNNIPLRDEIELEMILKV
jgi:N-acetylglutamate synthase-like GNAT family acetyltransferase